MSLRASPTPTPALFFAFRMGSAGDVSGSFLSLDGDELVRAHLAEGPSGPLDGSHSKTFRTG